LEICQNLPRNLYAAIVRTCNAGAKTPALNPHPIRVRVPALFGEERRPRVAEASHAAVMEVSEAISVSALSWCLLHRASK
jgi:hypothetical protein